MDIKPYELHTGKMEEVLPSFAPDSIDACVTDPPYGIRFMGKAWDSFDIAQRGAQRNSYPVGEKRLATGRTNAGFGNSIEAGRYNNDIVAMREFQSWTQMWAEQVYRVLKPGAWLIVFASPRTYHRMVSGIEEAGFEIRDQIFWTFGSGFPKSHNLDGKFEGWGTALKPAHEPILVARKPLIGTVKQNMELYGTGALNIKDCRIEGEPWTFGTQTDIRGGKFGDSRPSEGDIFKTNVIGGQDGRWPANLIHDGSDEVMALFPKAPGQMAPVGPENGEKPSVNTYGNYDPRDTFEPRQELDKSAARFFYCAKTSRLDRNEGCDDLEDRFLAMSNQAQAELKRGNEHKGKSGVNTIHVVKNNHPTVKPTDLMRYLCRLVTPKGGLILDPFCGSGSTGKAAMYEHMRFVGIDMDQHNIDISDRRILHALKHRDNQVSLF